MSYDKKCHELAQVFLSDEGFPTQTARHNCEDKLAQAIQDCIESFLEDAPISTNMPYSGSIENKE